MRKIILNLATSLDGLIEGPNGELDWLVRDESVDFADILTDILSDKDIIFYGRVSYEKWGHYRPEGNDVPQKLKAAYDLMHSKTKYVFSRTQKDDGTGAIFINSAIEATVQEIKQQAGRNIWLYGGGKLITTLLNLNMVDVFKLAVHPVILGQGKPLFAGITDRHQLKLVHVAGYPSGITLQTYEAGRK